MVGQGAPIFTQLERSAICFAFNFPFGGIFKSPSYATALISKLAAESPGIIAVPISPPLIIAALLSSFKPPFCLSGPWQEKQCSASKGLTFSSKNFSPALFLSAAKTEGTIKALIIKIKASFKIRIRRLLINMITSFIKSSH